jgi:hypothetical protein
MYKNDSCKLMQILKRYRTLQEVLLSVRCDLSFPFFCCVYTLSLSFSLSQPHFLTRTRLALSRTHTKTHRHTNMDLFCLSLHACMHACNISVLISVRGHISVFISVRGPSESRVRHCMFANIPAAMLSVLMSVVDICEHHVLRCLFAHDEVLSNTAQRMRRRRRLLTRQLRILRTTFSLLLSLFTAE